MRLAAKLVRITILSTALTALCAVGACAASIGVGTVEADALRLRESAGTEATVLATAAKGEAVVLLEDAGNNWYKVDYKSIEGYMSGEYLTVATKADVTIGYGLVKAEGSTLNVRSGPGTEYDKVTTLKSGAVVSIVGIDNGWYKLTYNGVTGYASSDYLAICKDSAGSRGDSTAAAPTASLGQQAVDYGKNFLGASYVYGASGPKSFDCSGFTSYVYRKFGYTLNRTASGQLSNGTSVSKSELQPGDLVFFKHNTTKAASHVGIYVGGGQFIHASTNSYTVRYDDLTRGHYANVYVGARRIF